MSFRQYTIYHNHIIAYRVPGQLHVKLAIFFVLYSVIDIAFLVLLVPYSVCSLESLEEF